MKFNVKFIGIFISVIMSLMFMSIPGAEATLYDFTTANVAFTGGPPFGTVDITADSGAGTVTFIVTALGDPSNKLSLFAFNTDLSLTPSNFTLPSLWGTATNQSEDGYGKFDWEVGNSAAAARVHQATIVISGLGVNATEAHFTLGSDDPNGGHVFVAHLIQPVPGADDLTGFINTPVVNTTGSPVPEPATILLLGCGLIGIWGATRKKE